MTLREAQKPDHVSLNSLLNRLKDGRYMVPDFQRDFEWKARDIRDLTRSIFLDYYIGSLLLWKGTQDHYRDLSCTPLYGRPHGSPEYIVLDGQQRLTAINYAFVAPDERLPTRVSRALYFVRVDRFMAEEYDDAFDFTYLNAGRGDGLTGFTAFYGAPERQYANHVFPLAVVGAGGWELSNWVQGYTAYWRQQAEAAEAEDARAEAALHAGNAVAFGEHLKSITETFQISYIELDRDLPIDKVCDIFTQINSKGVRLDIFDLLNALLKPKGVQLKAMWHAAAPRLEFVETGKLNVYILQVMSILRQTYSSPKYLYYLLPGVERKTRNADGSFERHVMIADAETFQPALGRSGPGARNRDRAPAPSAGIRRQQIHLSSLFRDPSRLRGGARRGEGAAAGRTGSPPTGASACGIGRRSSPTAIRRRAKRPRHATSRTCARGSPTAPPNPR
ncbi:DUF262 domain-containing protein [Sphingopyxis sp. PET50]|uniref:DUF262 domain-containing protein n=1 Tax=Sphingopyxis sp. PET50 TaxID=2976533 RepID=UPI0021AF80AC|nr:DUF262 domain-containing protein [Sphingopyxis sp. PET50]